MNLIESEIKTSKSRTRFSTSGIFSLPRFSFVFGCLSQDSDFLSVYFASHSIHSQLHWYGWYKIRKYFVDIILTKSLHFCNRKNNVMPSAAAIGLCVVSISFLPEFPSFFWILKKLENISRFVSISNFSKDFRKSPDFFWTFEFEKTYGRVSSPRRRYFSLLAYLVSFRGEGIVDF